MEMQVDNKRRLLLRGTLGVGALAGFGLLAPRGVLAAWPAEAFKADKADAAMNALLGGAPSASEAVSIKAPDIAENGAVVPITVETSAANVESISVFIPNNPSPLTANFVLGAGASGYAATRVKMGKTSDVIAVVKAGGTLQSATKEVKVTIGGCGG
jgi:sulfur-oxidizing protein SoxY